MGLINIYNPPEVIMQRYCYLLERALVLVLMYLCRYQYTAMASRTGPATERRRKTNPNERPVGHHVVDFFGRWAKMWLGRWCRVSF